MDEKQWSDIRSEYVTTNISYRQLSDKYGIAMSALRYRAKQGKWVEKRAQFRHRTDTKKDDIAVNAEAERYRKMIKCADTLTDAIFKAIMAAQTSEEGLSARDSKSYASALKDLKDVQSIRSADDAREQAARIAKLEKEVAGGEQSDDVAVIEIDGLPEAWRE